MSRRTIVMPAECFPLAWPVGVPRTAHPVNTMLGKEITLGRAIEEVYAELRRMKVASAVISSNLPTRIDGTPRGDQLPRGDDHGVAVYWTTTAIRAGQRVKVPHCMPCDRWRHVRQNLRAIAASLEALRGVERWGAVTVEQAFAGFAALPPGSEDPAEPAERPWREVLNVPADGWAAAAPADVVLLAARKNARELLKLHHPDRGGDPATAAEVNVALERAEAELGKEG